VTDQRPGSFADRLRAGGRYASRDEPPPPSVFELMDEPVDAYVVADSSEPEPKSDDRGGDMEEDRWHLLVTVGVVVSLVVGLVGIGLGVAALGKSTAPATPAPPPAPSAVVLFPSNGTKVSATTSFDVKPSISDVPTITLVATGGGLHNRQIAVAKPTLGGWVAAWDTTTVANATYQVSAVVYDKAGRSGRGPAIAVTVQN
jgi:hypothetical protein